MHTIQDSSLTFVILFVIFPLMTRFAEAPAPWSLKTGREFQVEPQLVLLDELLLIAASGEGKRVQLDSFDVVGQLVAAESGYKVPAELIEGLGFNGLSWAYVDADNAEDILLMGRKPGQEDKPFPLAQAEGTIVIKRVVPRGNMHGQKRDMVLDDIRIAGVMGNRVVAASYQHYPDFPIERLEVSLRDDEFPVPLDPEKVPHGYWKDTYKRQQQRYYDSVDILPTPIQDKYAGFRAAGITTDAMAAKSGQTDSRHVKTFRVSFHRHVRGGRVAELGDFGDLSERHGFIAELTDTSAMLKLDATRRDSLKVISSWEINVPSNLQKAA